MWTLRQYQRRFNGMVDAGEKGLSGTASARRGARPLERLPDSATENFDLITILSLSSFHPRLSPYPFHSFEREVDQHLLKIFSKYDE